MGKLITDSLFAYICGFGIGLYLGWYSDAGHIYYSTEYGIQCAVGLGAICSVASLIYNLFYKEK